MNVRGRNSSEFVMVLFCFLGLTGCIGNITANSWKTDLSSVTPLPLPAPSLVITGPAISSGSSATSFVYTVTYTDATTINLTNADIILGGTDFAGCNAVVTNGTTAVATVTVSGCTGDGTANISIAANTAQDADGNQAPAYGPSSNANVKNSFIVIFNTNNTEGGSSANTVATFPLVDWIGYDFEISWGDSSTQTVNSPSSAGRVITHTYGAPGTYEVKMKGSNLPWLQFCSGTDKLKIVDVKQWGPNAWWKMEFMFANCKNVQISATDAPVLTSLASGFRGLFQGATNFNSDINHWTTTAVTDMRDMFAGAAAFNKPLGNWDVSNVTDMSAMFGGAVAFNQNISSWNTSNVTDMAFMFFEASAFNSPLAKSGSSWDTSKVVSMAGMFEDADAFNQDIGNWVFTGSMTNMDQMFLNADSFNQNLSTWVLPVGVSHNLFDTGAASWVLGKPTFP
ncbi:membrane associated lipoprotein [Bdellovibrio bacteriovorus]|uniref:Membrane associated lipoprotein n=1 Tax=Bdellovibrio bacteriovorus TaxID=959 RepID=A0A150WUC2_BDEBC|nr:BspA family leucine-rich repeat surface protein [Bdellovibrio bacteriovorus]KYG70044.1 membrane associated lipoprotein [Bdellovibrio bacteriovorus]